MTVTPLLNDMELVAYVDGRLPVERISAITQAAKSDAGLAARIGELAAGSPDLGGLWDDMLQAAPVGLMPPPAAAVHAPISRRAWIYGVGGIALGFVAGFGVWRLPPRSGADWEAVVAEYHSLYAPITVAGLTPSAATQLAELAAVERASGLPVVLPSLPDLTYRRAQMLELKGRPIVHIVLTTADVVPIAYCLTPDTKGARGFEYRQIGDLGLVSWATGEAASLLVARLPEGQLLALAKALAA